MLIPFLTILFYAIFVFFTVFSQKTVISLYFLSIISLPLFVIYQQYNASDVALTEIVIGSFLSFFILHTVHTKTHEHGANKKSSKSEIIPMVIICLSLFCLMLFLGITIESLITKSIYSTEYNTTTYSQTHINNTVTAILASYRGFDTLGETLIIAVSSFGLPTILHNSIPKTPTRKP